MTSQFSFAGVEWRRRRGGVVKGQHRLVGAVVSRAALALVALAAAAALLSPTAAASPESDADDAITAAWEDAGGENSDLGAKQGDVYAVGAGFAQDFANGKMFYTPDTGARSMYGAVLEKYESLGGPANSDLGFPTIDEVPGLAGPDSRNSTFSAGDKPVIFWTPDHGAHVVRGAINAAWDKLGSSGGVLGVPVGDETYDGQVATQLFSGGQVSWNRQTKVFTTTPPELAQQLTGLQVPIDPTAAINMAWRAAGGASGPLGAKQGGQYAVGDDGQGQDFAGGKVFFSPATGANAVESEVLAKYESLGGPVGSDLGFPTANEADGGIKPASRISTFSGVGDPVIFWTPDHGAFVVRGAMKAAWDKLGGPTGQLGAPVGDETVDRDIVAQKFTGGKIAWDRAKNTFSTEPSQLASALSGLQIPGQNQPAGSAQPADTGAKRAWHSWWLLVIIPVLLLIGLVAVAAPWWSRRRMARREAPVYEPDHDMDAGYDGEPKSRVRWAADGDSDSGSSAFTGGYAEAAPAAAPASSSDTGWMPPGGAGFDEPLPREETSSGAAPSEFETAAEAEDPDAVDTAPTRIPTESEISGGRHAATDSAAEAEAEPEPMAPVAADQPAIHLPLQDAHEAPDGYPVKGNVSFGLYYTPDSALYDDAFAEIWFTTEEVAQANGFTKAM
nr:LGFP repeat-containing protein [Mycobacterium kyorinense]